MKRLDFFLHSEFFLGLLLITNLFKYMIDNYLPFDITMALLILCLVFSIRKMIVDKRKINMNIQLLWFCTVIFYSLSMFYTPSIIYARYKYAEIVGIIPIVLLSTDVLVKNKDELKTVVKVFTISGIILSILAFSGYRKEYTTYALGSNYLVYGRQAFLAVIFLLMFYMPRMKTILGKSFIFFLTLICIISIMISGSMSISIVLFVSIILFVLLRLKKVTSTFIIVFLITFSFYYLYSNGYLDTVLWRINNGLFGSENNFYSRRNYFSVGLKMIENKPFFGHGIGSFSIFFNGTDTIDYPHNVFVEIIDEVGIIGFIPFAILTGYFCRNTIKYFIYAIKQRDRSSASLILSLFVYAFNMMLSSSVGSIRIVYFIFVVSSRYSLFFINEENDSLLDIKDHTSSHSLFARAKIERKNYKGYSTEVLG